MAVTETQIEDMARMWREGLVAREIAAAVGITPGSFAGLTHRRRDLFPARPSNFMALKAKPRSGGRKRGKAAGGAGQPSVFRSTPERHERHVAEAVAAVSGGRFDLDRHALAGVEPVPFLDVRNGQCRFPLQSFGEPGGVSMMCCGAEVLTGRSYCAAHQAICCSAVSAAGEA